MKKPDVSAFDLTNPDHHFFVRGRAEQIMQIHASWQEVQQPSERDIFEHLACRLARARLYALSIDKALRVLMVTNLLGENNRLRPKTADNPNGEDALRRKTEEINWLVSGTHLTIDQMYVSGGDPWGSEDVWNEQALKVRKEYPNSAISMVRTRDYPEWKGRNTNDKGGEWNLGLHLMTHEVLKHQYDYIYLTDADTTFNLASTIGESILHAQENGWDVVLGNRKDPASILQKNAKRSGTGAGWYYYISRHLGRQFYDMGILDTQCPSRLYSYDAAQTVSKRAHVDGWAIETDHNNALIAAGYGLRFTPVVAVDSEAESVGHKLPFNETPDTAYRLTNIFQGQISQLNTYKDAIDLPHRDITMEVAAIVEEQLIPYEAKKPWMGLSRLLRSSIEPYSEYPLERFNPNEISVEEFERVVNACLDD